MEEQDIDVLFKHYNWLIRARKREHKSRGKDSSTSRGLDDLIHEYREFIMWFAARFEIELPKGFNND